jgi:flagellar hook-associated protein FlgK
MKIEIFNGEWTLDDVKKQSDKVFVFGDNNARVGKGGQAIIRDLPNSVGIRTKKGPSTKPAAYYNDSEFESNKKNILEDVLNVKKIAMGGKTIVFSSGGYGTGLASLKQKAPKTFDYLNFLLKEHFNFDNKKGSTWFKIPGHDEITTGRWIEFDKDETILKPINNSFFDQNLLKKSLNTTFDLIKSENKIAFTSKSDYKNGEIIIFRFVNNSEYLVCRVIESYNLIETPETMKDYKWYSFEGYNKSFNISGPDNLIDRYQTHFQFICTLDDSGKMIFKKEVFSQQNSEPKVDKKKVKVIGDPIVKEDKSTKESENTIKEEKKLKNMTNEDLENAIKSINQKLDSVIEKVNKIESKKKGFFSKKNLEELLSDMGIIGKITKIEGITSNNNYEVETKDFIYYINYETGLFRNKVYVLIKKQK